MTEFLINLNVFKMVLIFFMPGLAVGCLMGWIIGWGDLRRKLDALLDTLQAERKDAGAYRRIQRAMGYIPRQEEKK